MKRGLSRTHRSLRTTRGRMRKLYLRLLDLGFHGFSLRWEPIGPALEMCGHSGGYIMVEREREIVPLGTSLGEALHNADGHAAYVRAFHPERRSEAG